MSTWCVLAGADQRLHGGILIRHDSQISLQFDAHVLTSQSLSLSLCIFPLSLYLSLFLSPSVSFSSLSPFLVSLLLSPLSLFLSICLLLSSLSHLFNSLPLSLSPSLSPSLSVSLSPSLSAGLICMCAVCPVTPQCWPVLSSRWLPPWFTFPV